MSLRTEFLARYSTQLALNLSNPDSAATVTADSARLDLACTDAEADFELYTAMELDLTNAMHVSVAVEGVKLIMQERGSASDEEGRKFREAWLKKLEGVAQRIGGEQRILPQSTGIAAPASEEVIGGTTRQKFDAGYFRDLNPGNPSAKSIDNPE